MFIFLHVKTSEVSQLYLTLCDPMDHTYQVPLSIGFSRQEYWSGLPLNNQPAPNIYQFSRILIKILARCFKEINKPIQKLYETTKTNNKKKCLTIIKWENLHY